MRTTLVALVGLMLGGTIGCDGSPAAPDAPPLIDAWPVPVFRNPLPAMTDGELATQSLQIFGADVAGALPQSCNGCHGVTKQKLRYWRALSDTSLTSCLTDLAPTDPQVAMSMINCVREMPALDTSDYKAKNLGIYSTAAKLPWFEYVFHIAYPDGHQEQLADFQTAVGMPKDLASMTQEQFDIVAEWYARGLPGLDETLVTDPPPSTCENGVSADVGTHVATMATTGWRVINRMNNMSMHGCGSATNPLQCLTSYPLATEQPYGAGWTVPGKGTMRVLADNTYVSSYWTRSSADGRFVGHGVSNIQGSYVIDLGRDGLLVPIDALYDPAFFPDNSGFVFQGGPRNTCAISVLTSNPATVAMTEAACRRINNIGLYQHVGQGTGAGADYFALDNEFESDDGGKQPTRSDPDASFSSQAYLSFTALAFNGTQFVAKGTYNVDTPFEGDAVLSHSAKLVISRVANPQEDQLGFVLRKVIATPAGGAYTYATPEVARFCFSGGKPGFSFDERWVAFHHYVTDADAVELGFTGPNDPGFSAYRTQGAANLYLLELATGVRTRITNMAPGQYALFPHFRADNWIYAQVRDANLDHEYTIAHDGALILE
ncbi:MAG: hypothetical protein ACKV2T_12760 [Kofleriaceae bacterium]